jgi:hypothetical protein
MAIVASTAMGTMGDAVFAITKLDAPGTNTGICFQGIAAMVPKSKQGLYRVSNNQCYRCGKRDAPAADEGTAYWKCCSGCFANRTPEWWKGCRGCPYYFECGMYRVDKENERATKRIMGEAPK